jgi:hypothetical protein
MNSYIWYASLCGLSQNAAVPSLAISTFCLLGYVSSTSSASTMPEYCFAFFGHIDTFSLELYASWATLPLGILCLLGCFASWATLPLGLLCLLGYFASWAALPLGLLCLLGYFASWAALPLGLLCLLGFISTLCLLGYVSSTLSTLTMPVYWYASWDVPSLGTC